MSFHSCQSVERWWRLERAHIINMNTMSKTTLPQTHGSGKALVSLSIDGDNVFRWYELQLPTPWKTEVWTAPLQRPLLSLANPPKPPLCCLKQTMWIFWLLLAHSIREHNPMTLAFLLVSVLSSLCILLRAHYLSHGKQPNLTEGGEWMN